MPIYNHDDIIKAGQYLQKYGVKNVLIKGGHSGNINESTDILITEDDIFHITKPRLPYDNVHGTGCGLASAIASFLACGYNIYDAVCAGKDYIYQAIYHANVVGTGSRALYFECKI